MFLPCSGGIALYIFVSCVHCTKTYMVEIWGNGLSNEFGNWTIKMILIWCEKIQFNCSISIYFHLNYSLFFSKSNLIMNHQFQIRMLQSICVSLICNKPLNILLLELNWWKINKILEHWIQRKYESNDVILVRNKTFQLNNQNGIRSTVISAGGNKIELNSVNGTLLYKMYKYI